MKITLDPVTRRGSVQLDHADEWRRHAAKMPRPTLRRSDQHLFREAR